MVKNQRETPIGIFTGGGTGGHVYPGLAVWEKVQSWWTGRLLWVGSRHGMEKKIVEDLGIKFKGIPAGKLRRYFSFQNLTDSFKILAGFLIMLLFFGRTRVSFVFSKGGFVTVPVVWAARFFGIPVFSHESDLVPGLATRLNLSASQLIFVSHDRVRSLLPARYRSHVVVTGNPIRSRIKSGRPELANKHWNLPEGKPLVLVLGGSSGALQINELIPNLVHSLEGRAFVLHQCGQKWAIPQMPNYLGIPYIGSELADALARADLLVSRAGAGSLWEAAFYRLPMILIPLKAGSRGDQIINARHWEKMGCAKVLIDPSSSELNLAVNHTLENPEELRKMRQAFGVLSFEDSADLISRRILSSLSF